MRRLRTATIISAVLGALLVSAGTPMAHTGAWFTASSQGTGNSMSTGALSNAGGLYATVRQDGVNIGWNSALTQPWATDNSLTDGVRYTVTQNLNGQTQTVYSGGDTSTTIKYPKAQGGARRDSLAADLAVGAAIRSDGRVVTWGSETMGWNELGNGAAYNPTPALVDMPADQLVADISVGATSTYALTTTGSVWAWGGVASNCGGSGPRQIALPSGKRIVSVSATSGCIAHLLASDGTGWVWSARSNTSYQISMPGGRAIAQFSHGKSVLAVDGTAWYFYGDNEMKGTPEQVALPSGRKAVQVISTEYTDHESSAALLDDNTIYTWGDNEYGQLGAGFTGGWAAASLAQKFQVPSDRTWVKIVSQTGVTAALASDGSIWAAGRNWTGILGDGTSTDRNVPVKASSSQPFVDVAYGAQAAFAKDASGAVWAWGFSGPDRDVYGGGNPKRYSYTPVPVGNGLVVATPTQVQLCLQGGNLNSGGYCAPEGNSSYNLSYSYQKWSAPTDSAAASTTAVQTGSLRLKGPGDTKLCAGFGGDGASAGSPLILTDCSGDGSPLLTTWSDGTWRRNGLCLDVKGTSMMSPVQLWPCNGTGFQWWIARADGSLYNPASEMCLDDPAFSTKLGTQMQIWTCNPSAWNQWWKLTA